LLHVQTTCQAVRAQLLDPNGDFAVETGNAGSIPSCFVAPFAYCCEPIEPEEEDSEEP